MELFRIGGGPMAKTNAERSQKWRAAHPEQARKKSTESTRKYRAENPEKVREYQREYRRAYRARQKAAKAAAGTQASQSPAKLSDQERESIYKGLKDKGLV